MSVEQETEGSSRDACIAAHYLAGRPQLPPTVVKHLISLLNPVQHASIVDLGCGPGRLLRAMRRYHVPIIGIDTSESMLEHAKEHTSGLSRIYLTAHLDEYMSRWHSKEDALVMVQSFHLIPPEEILPIVRHQSAETRSAVIWMDHLPTHEYSERCKTLFEQFRIKKGCFDQFYSRVHVHAEKVGLTYVTSHPFSLRHRVNAKILASYLYSLSYVHQTVPVEDVRNFLTAVQHHFANYETEIAFSGKIAVFKPSRG